MLRNESQEPPSDGTMHIATRAMACEFSVVTNPVPHEQLLAAGEVLELVHEIERALSIYRPNSLLSRINRSAAERPVEVTPELFSLLEQAEELRAQTDGSFDMACGALFRIWREARRRQEVPSSAAVKEALAACGMRHVELNRLQRTVAFRQPGVELDAAGIGKGYALDRMCAGMEMMEGAPDNFLIHGGRSSLVARGDHAGGKGWPVGIGNPLLTRKRLGILRLRDQALSTSGSNVQFYRHAGKRFGHILDAQSGYPAEGMLSVTVVTDSAAAADALSTAFFALGVEKALACCDNLPHVGAILTPMPERGRVIRPLVCRIPLDRLEWDSELVEPEFRSV